MALSVTLQNLCCVYALRKGAGVNGLEYIFNSLGSNKEVNHSRAERLYRQAKKINIV
jgi:hypothetical protein